MLFNSFSYAIFLPIVFIMYWALPHRYRWTLLLTVSYYFYMSWNIKYIFLILLTTAVSFTCALLLEKTEDMKKRKVYLLIALFVCSGILFLFKYFNFFFRNVSLFLNVFWPSVPSVSHQLLLPVGISFYTFQTLSYVIDVYKGDIEAERHLGIYATFISFFPQLVAGPIERASNFLPQIRKKHNFHYEKATYGLKLMAWGYFKKIVVADTFAVYVDRVYNNIYDYEGFALLIVAFMFSFQIYCDFSGYSDIAIGTAKLFDIDLMKNFSSPYLSSSIKEFWSRWHISLSTWFRDYVYIPLGGNRCGRTKTFFHLLITFLASGLWHGANQTYILWGAVHGMGQIGEKILGGHEKRYSSAVKIRRCVAVVSVFCFCTFAWIFFRAESMKDVLYIFLHIFSTDMLLPEYFKTGIRALEIPKIGYIKIAGMIGLLFLFDYYNMKIDVIEHIGKMKKWLRWIIYVVFILIIIYLKPIQSGSQFIYFQF